MLVYTGVVSFLLQQKILNLRKESILTMSNQIKKREIITNEIFAELEKKYPLRGEKSGVCYAQDMDYITIEVVFFENAKFRMLVEENNQIFIIYALLRKSMSLNGWNYPWDEDNQKDFATKSTLWGIAKTDCLPLVQLLIDKGLILVVNRNGLDYLTDTQQIYNWEMLQAKRARDRKSKSSEGKTKKKTSEQQDKTENELMEEHFSTYEQDIANYYNNNCYTDENGCYSYDSSYDNYAPF